MYCPQCATQNPGDVKFCRSCGLELQNVALALSKKSGSPSKRSDKKSQPQTVHDWMEKRIESASSITRGAILLSVSLMLAIPMALFLPSSFDAPWILIWTVFFGWMAVWGGIEMAYGLSGMIEAKGKLRLLGSDTADVSDKLNPSASASITEGTTRQLND
jgi:hypothetical protein